MSDVFGVFTRNTGADMEFVDKASGTVVFAFRTVIGSQTVQSATDNLTAKAGGLQPGATPLLGAYNRVVTVVSSGDSVLLPASMSGLDVVVINAHATNAINVFPQTTDNAGAGGKINALAANSAFSVAATKTCTFYCCTAGQWHTMLTA